MGVLLILLLKRRSSVRLLPGLVIFLESICSARDLFDGPTRWVVIVGLDIDPVPRIDIDLRVGIASTFENGIRRNTPIWAATYKIFAPGAVSSEQARRGCNLCFQLRRSAIALVF